MFKENVFKRIAKNNKKFKDQGFGLKLYIFVLCALSVLVLNINFVDAQTPKAKNIILMIADGWGPKHIEATNDYTNSTPS